MRLIELISIAIEYRVHCERFGNNHFRSGFAPATTSRSLIGDKMSGGEIWHIMYIIYKHYIQASKRQTFGYYY